MPEGLFPAWPGRRVSHGHRGALRTGGAALLLSQAFTGTALGHSSPFPAGSHPCGMDPCGRTAVERHEHLRSWRCQTRDAAEPPERPQPRAGQAEQPRAAPGSHPRHSRGLGREIAP